MGYEIKLGVNKGADGNEGVLTLDIWRRYKLEVGEK